MRKNYWLGVLLALGVLFAGGCARSLGAPSPMPEPSLVYYEGGMEEELPASPSGHTADISVERLVIRTANLDLIVPDTTQAMDQIAGIAEELEGYVVSMDSYQYEEGLVGNVTIRVPAESFDTTLDRIRGLATTIRQESVSGQDVTEEYIDLESDLRHLRAKEARLLEIMEEAEDTQDVLAVYQELSLTQQEIERTTGRMQYLENQASLSTITISLTPDALAQPLEVGGWNLPGTVRHAVQALLAVVEFLVKALIYLILLILPTLLLVVLPIAGLVRLVRWLVRRRRRA